jgi:hypothetical protein
VWPHDCTSRFGTPCNLLSVILDAPKEPLVTLRFRVDPYYHPDADLDVLRTRSQGPADILRWRFKRHVSDTRRTAGGI